MSLSQYLSVLSRRWKSAVSVLLAVVFLAVALTFLMTPRYTSTARLFFGVEGGESLTDLAQGSSFAEKQMESYAGVATSQLVLNAVIGRLQLPVTTAQLAEQVEARAPLNTVMLEISVEDTDATMAARIADAVAAEVITVSGKLAPARANGSEAVRATVLDRATVAEDPSSPQVVRNLVIGLAAGLAAGAAVALLREVLDTKIRDHVGVEAITDVPVLGSIAFDEHVPEHPVIISAEPRGQPAEAIRRLRTNLQFLGASGSCLVVTSSTPGEGKSTTSLNLAASLADAGARVILVETDLRRPSIAKYTGLEGGAGLTSVLIGRAELADVVQPWGDGSLSVLTSGPVPPNPSEMLGSQAMSQLLDQLKASYDVVLLDTPPLLPVTDATVLATLVGGALVVVGVDRLHRRQLQESLETLRIAGAPVRGLVINKLAKRRLTGGYGYRYASYAAVVEPAPSLSEAPEIVPAGLSKVPQTVL